MTTDDTFGTAHTAAHTTDRTADRGTPHTAAATATATARTGTRPRVVAFGGGHGLAASLSALRALPVDVTAVVTVADDGGSSGRLRRELDALPPGDLRMALAAVAGGTPQQQRWCELLQHRFGGDGPLAGHAVGNLMLTALAETTGDPVAALDLVGALLGASARVLPSARVPLEIVAEVVELDHDDPGASVQVRGQVAVATTAGRVVNVRLDPAEPPATPEVVHAVGAADWLLFGPGSWFTSVLPHLLVPDVAKALVSSPARRLLTLNLAPQPGETDGFSPEAHVEVFEAHAPDLSVDMVLVDPSVLPEPDSERRLRDCVAGLAADLLVRPVAIGDGTPRHDPGRLAAAYCEIITPGGQAWR